MRLLYDDFFSRIAPPMNLTGVVSWWTLLLLNGLAWAASPPGTLVADHFDVADGLPGAQIRAIYEDPAGHIWVGTEDGAARFVDGWFVRVPLDRELSQAFVLDIRVLDGTPYLLTDRGLFQIAADGQATLLKPNPRQSVVGHLTPGLSGSLLSSDGHDLVRVTGQQLTPLPTEGLDVRSALEDEKGLWIGASQGLYRLERGELSQKDIHPVRHLLMAPEGLYLIGPDGLRLRRNDGTVVALGEACFGTDLGRLADGRIAVGCGDGLRLGSPDGGWERFGEPEGLAGTILTRLLVDHEGMLWLGSLNQGIARVIQPDLRFWTRGLHGLQASSITRLFVDDNRLVIANYADVLQVDPDFSVHPPPEPDLRKDVFALHRFDRDLFFVRVLAGVQKVIGDGRTQQTTPAGVDMGNQPPQFIEAQNKLVAWGPEQTRILMPPEETIFKNPETLLTEVPRNGEDSWVASERNFWSFQNGWKKEAPVPPDCGTLDLAHHTADGWLLGCGENLLSGPSLGKLTPLLSLPSGSFRLAERLGAATYVSSVDHLYRLGSPIKSLGTELGLPHVQFVGGGRMTTFQGWLAVSTSSGILWMRPTLFDREFRAPEVYIRRILVGDREVPNLDALRPGDDFLSVSIGSSSNAGFGHVFYRFRLDAGDWIEVDGRDPIRLPGLAAGNHNLDVEARALGSDWSPQPAHLSWSLPAPWFRRPAVQAAAIFFLSGLAATLAWQRNARLLAELNRLKEREELTSVFGRFVTPEVATEVLAGRLRAEGEEVDVTVLFVDIRGFTPLTERLAPHRLVAALNHWFGLVIAEVEREGGMVNKMMGDALVAIFGAPRPLPDHADRAMRAGLAMVRSLAAHRAEMETEFGMALDAGVGLNTGTAIAGPIGAQSRMEYTVIGETVNVAARVEAATRILEVPLLLTEAVRLRLTTPPDLVDKGFHRLKGVGQAVQLWAPAL